MFIRQSGPLGFDHYDFYAQWLSKVERGHPKDVEDTTAMLARGLVERVKLRELFEAIESSLYRYPSVDGPVFKAAVEAALK